MAAFSTVAVFRWYRASIHTDAVKLVRDGGAWADAGNTTGVWDVVHGYYEFTIDTSDAAKYSEQKSYELWEGNGGGGGTLVEDDIMLGDLKTAKDLYEHEQLSQTVHGLTAAGSLVPAEASNYVVGTTEHQTLKNKSIDGASNTLSVRPIQVKASSDSQFPSIASKPTASDPALFVEEADASSITLQAAKYNDKTTDRILRVKATKVSLKNNAGSQIVLDGLAAATANGEAVRYNEFHAVDLRVAALEVGASWGTAPTVGLALISPARYRISAAVYVDAAHIAKAARFEFYFSNNGWGGIAAGLRSTDEIDMLRAGGDWQVRRPGEGRAVIYNCRNQISVIVIAFDKDGIGYSSAEGVATPFGANAEDGVVDVANAIAGAVLQAGFASGNTVSAAGTWQQTNTTPIIKQRSPYKHSSANSKLRCTYYGYAGTISTDTGGMRVEIYDGSVLMKSQDVKINYAAAMPTTPAQVDIDVTASGLVDAKTYELRVSTWNDDGTGIKITYLRSDIHFEAIQTVQTALL